MLISHEVGCTLIIDSDLVLRYLRSGFLARKKVKIAKFF